MDEMILAAIGPWWFLFAIAVIVLGSGRVTRLLVHDSFPPAAWLRQQWFNLTKDKGDWHLLAVCWWCAGPWVTLFCLGWFMLGFTAVWIAWSWWLFWGWMSLSYLVSMVVARDEPKD